MLCNTSLASLAVFASQRCSNHASNTKVGFIKFPQAEELINNSFLLGNAVQLGNEARIKQHAGYIKVARHAIRSQEEEVE
jgi:hypothetical protein